MVALQQLQCIGRNDLTAEWLTSGPLTAPATFERLMNRYRSQV
jgi:hypothetical protein